MKEFEVSRDNFEDRGEGTLADGYTSLDQVSKIVQFYLNGQRNHGENLRDALAFLFSHYFLLRGESIRNAELTDFQTINLDFESVRPNIKCPALYPSRDLPYYNFWLVTHINRGSAARMADLAGVNEDQIRRLGRWKNTTINGAYLTGLPREVMRVMAGFTVQQGQFYLPRASVDPHESFCKMIFPDLDVWHDRLTAKQANPNNEDEMEVTVAAKAFFEFMFLLRKTIIQDAVFMIEKFPTHPLWQNSLFSHELFTDYRERMLIVAQEDNDPVNALLQRCVPILEGKIKCMHHDLSTRLDTQSASQEKIIDYITRLVTGQATIPQQSEPNSFSSSNAMDHSQTFHGNINNNVVPCYRMSRGIVSVNDLWRE
ncbi:hypothetical protein INT47_013030 [Mucor saturninus]|uniref:Ndc10 domain-containing protein n=1 Tax=Mucor saturninus TaxID=64648 RepID=A0A8H7V4L9_9FUNG|nr:hypothetical protein INT47_013030 [Mucor saturninus]